MTNQVIPEAAVEAAVEAHCEGTMREALEAAAPHMLAGLRELVEDMERQPPSEIATVPGLAVLIRAAVGDVL